MRRIGFGGATLLLVGGAAAQAPVNGVQATTVPLSLPGGLAYDSLGNLYIAATNDHVVRVVSPTGVINTYAGTGAQGLQRRWRRGHVGATGFAGRHRGGRQQQRLHRGHAQQPHPRSERDGVITTIAGTGAAGFPATARQPRRPLLNYPTALAVDAAATSISPTPTTIASARSIRYDDQYRGRQRRAVLQRRRRTGDGGGAGFA